MTKSNFWQTKKLSEFSPDEWESICTRCGKCCQIKLQDEDTDEIFYTDLVCRYFDIDHCNCTQYHNRCRLVPTCLKLTPQNLAHINWIPHDCAYHILQTTGDLPDWHPLKTGQALAQERSVHGKVISETMVAEDEWEDHIIEDEPL